MRYYFTGIIDFDFGIGMICGANIFYNLACKGDKKNENKNISG